MLHEWSVTAKARTSGTQFLIALEHIGYRQYQIVGKDKESGSFLYDAAAARALVADIIVISGPYSQAELQIQVGIEHIGISSRKPAAIPVPFRCILSFICTHVIFLILHFSGNPPS